MKKTVAIVLALLGAIWAFVKIIDDLESIRRRRDAYDAIYKSSKHLY